MKSNILGTLPYAKLCTWNYSRTCVFFFHARILQCSAISWLFDEHRKPGMRRRIFEKHAKIRSKCLRYNARRRLSIHSEGTFCVSSSFVVQECSSFFAHLLTFQFVQQGLCNYRRQRAAAKLKTWGILPPKDEHALQMALVFHGPVAVSVNASPKTFQLYS